MGILVYTGHTRLEHSGKREVAKRNQRDVYAIQTVQGVDHSHTRPRIRGENSRRGLRQVQKHRRHRPGRIGLCRRKWRHCGINVNVVLDERLVITMDALNDGAESVVPTNERDSGMTPRNEPFDGLSCCPVSYTHLTLPTIL